MAFFMMFVLLVSAVLVVISVIGVLVGGLTAPHSSAPLQIFITFCLGALGVVGSVMWFFDYLD